MEERHEVVAELIVCEAQLVLALVNRVLVAEIDDALRASRENPNRIILLLVVHVADENDVDGAVDLREDGHRNLFVSDNY